MGPPGKLSVSRGPRLELREPGASYLTTQEDAGSSPSPLPLPITPEAASMQRSPAVNSGTPTTPKPESDGDDFWTVKEDVAHAHPDRAEPDPLMDESESDDEAEAEETFRAETSGAEDEDSLLLVDTRTCSVDSSSI